MRYIKNYNKFKNTQPVNEELLGGILNFFKGMWNKAVGELQKLGKNPSMDQIDQWVEKNPFNPADDSYMLKSVMDEFKKQPSANDQACIDLIDTILNPETGALGKSGLQPFYDQLLKAFGNNLQPLNVITYYMETIRNRAIKDYKYAGGPDLKVGVGQVLDVKKIKNYTLTDLTTLPDLKKLLTTAGADDKKKRQSTIDWVEKTLLIRLQKYATEIKDEDVTKYLEAKGIEVSDAGDFKVGDTVIYKRDAFKDKKEDWDALTDDDKKKPTEGKIKDLETAEAIGTKKISKIEGDKVSFEGADFTKLTSDILMKIDVTKVVDGQEELTNTLKDLKTKNPEAIKKIEDISKLYADPGTNKAKIEEIDKIVAEGEE
jgi:hypothetical protein